jgi:hypothetical protein
MFQIFVKVTNNNLKLKRTLQLILLSLMSLAGSLGCVSASNLSSAKVPESPEGDKEYAEAYRKWHTRLSVTDQFQKKFDADGVLFSNEMRKAYTERWQRLRGKNDAGLGDLSGGKLAVILSYFSPEDDYLELGNTQLWSVSLEVGGKTYAPALIQRLQQKTALQGFFPFVNHWTADYLLVFDANSDESGASQGSIDLTKTQLKLSSALVQANLGW